MVILLGRVGESLIISDDKIVTVPGVPSETSPGSVHQRRGMLLFTLEKSLRGFVPKADGMVKAGAI